MKILFAIKSLDGIKGGAERVLTVVASGLQQRGHAVSVLTFDPPGSLSFFPLDAEIQRLYCPVGDPHARTGLLDFIRRIVRLRALIKRERPDVVVAFMHSMFVPAALSLIGTGIPLVASEHIVPAHYQNKKIEYALLILASFLARRVTVLSRRIINLYPWLIRHKMVEMSNPVAISKDDTKSPLPEKTRRILLNVGRLDPQKDQKTLIRAFATLADRYPDWDVRIVGEGELWGSLLQEIKAQGLSGRVILAGSTDRIDREYAGADLFVMPSLYESFGLVSVEAMAFGLPVIGFQDCDGTNEIVRSGENGLLVTGKDRVLALATAMEQLMSDVDLRTALGGAGPASVAAYGVEPVLTRWESLLSEVAGRAVTL